MRVHFIQIKYKAKFEGPFILAICETKARKQRVGHLESKLKSDRRR